MVGAAFVLVLLTREQLALAPYAYPSSQVYVLQRRLDSLLCGEPTLFDFIERVAAMRTSPTNEQTSLAVHSLPP